MNRGDIVLISYPFTDLSSQIVRPALIVSTEDFHRCGGDAIFLFITKEKYHTPYDFIIGSSDSDFNFTGTFNITLIHEQSNNYTRNSTSRY